MVDTVAAVLAALLVVILLANRLAPLTAARLGMDLERWRAGLRLKRAAVPGFVMPYLEGGQGAPLVLVHGFGGDKDNFTRIARFLTPHYHVVIPDLPGFGEATRDAAASYTIAEQVERLRAFLDQVAPGPVHLGGNSMGGFIAAQFAATYPQRVASLWLLDPAGTAAAQSSAILERYRDTGDIPLLLRQVGDIDRMIASATHREPFLPYCVRKALGQRGVADHALHSQIMHQLTTAPLLEQQYRELAPPTLIVWGQQDRILDPSGAAALGALFRRSRTILMPNIGHLPMLEAPRQSARDYLAFRRERACA
ncbi:alpha/beta fold hydrolase [Duganella sp. FT3S]|uniref:Alpha/beta fold hydrolase n=1 Tax=Rugamonas fusca TaxID=2758568 RepID=A0A7W2EH83_9BURK|nr:alpha/beta fold hydrolase [Rugamonas fusca]MBA5605889.1 alpha/beta fold hydrolase [Rugamonas fusca]